MKTLFKYLILPFLVLLSTGLIINAQEFYKLEDFGDTKQVEKIEKYSQKWTHDQLDVKAAVERILTAAGNYDRETIAEMVMPHANMGIARLKDGEWITETLPVSEFLETFETGTKTPYLEPVSEYKIHISDGKVAIVKADAILYRFGIPTTYEMDNFTLLKQDGTWKIVNVSFSATPVPLHKQQFELQAFAKGYTQAWCSNAPELVAQFYAEDGVLTVNDREPAKGRKAIGEVARGFMKTFWDLTLTCDKVTPTDEGIEFHWTFTGTYTGVKGMNHEVEFSGVELWQMDENNSIKNSKGQFDKDEYARQMNYGAED